MSDPGNLLIYLMTRQLATLTGLGALGHLDLDIIRIDQVFGSHTKAA